MSKLSVQTNRLLTIQVIHLLIENSNQALLTLFLWRATSLQTVIEYRLIEVSIIPLMALIGGFIIDRISPKLNFTLGVFFLSLQLLAVTILGSNVRAWITPLAILSGISSIQRFMSLNVINQQNIEEDQVPLFFSKLAVSSKIIGIVFPLLSGVIINRFGYAPIFGLSFMLCVVMVILCIQLKLLGKHSPYQPFRIYREWDREKTSLFLTNLLWGVEFGLLITMLPITTTLFLKGEQGWGIFTAILALVGIIYSIFLGKLKITKTNVSLLVVFGFLLSMSALIFASTAVLSSYVLFMMTLQFWQSSQMIGLRPLLGKIVKSDPNISILSTEYQGFLEIPFFLGRVVSLAVLLLVHEQLQHVAVLGVLFTVLGLIPIYEAKSISLSKVAFAKERV